MKRILTYEVEGLNSQAYASAVERAAIKVKGVHIASANLKTGKIRLVVNKHFNEEVFLKTIILSGFEARLIDISKSQKKSKFFSLSTQLSILLVFLIPLLYLSTNELFKLPLPNILNPRTNPLNYAILQILLTIPILVVGYKYYLKGLKNLIKLKSNIDTLIAISISASFLYSLYAIIMILIGNKEYVTKLYFESVGIVLFFVILGKYLKQKSTSKTTIALEKLRELKLDKAIKYDNGDYIEVSMEEVRIGDLLVVKAKEKIPTDGIIKEGITIANESIITGEPLPKEKSIGDKVIGGTINLTNEIIIEVTHINEKTILDSIIKRVSESQVKKTQLEKKVDKVITYYVPIVIITALLGFVFGIIFTKEFNLSLNIFISILVISCPCALGLSTPIAVMTSSRIADNYGILIYNGKALEVAYKDTLVILDKTKIVTKGKLTLQEIITTSNYFENELLQIALSLELRINHPIAEAIKTYAQDLNIKEREVVNFENHVGLGLKGEINGKVYFIGNEKWMIDNNIKVAQEKNIIKKGEGKSYLYIGTNVLIGLISFSDELREEIKEIVKKLHQLNIKTVLLSGDDEATVSHIAKEVGISDYYGSLLPTDKQNIIKKLKEKHTVLMVGDGISNATFLNEADVGITISDGTNVALISGDVVLMNNNLHTLLILISLSKRTTKTIKENLFWAFFYNIIGIFLALGVLCGFNILLSPIVASLLMVLSSISIILNTLKLKRFSGLRL